MKPDEVQQQEQVPTYFGGKYKTLEEYDKAHKEITDGFHRSSEKVKALEQELAELKEAAQVLANMYNATREQLEAGGNPPASEGNTGEFDTGEEDFEDYLTLSGLKKALPDLLREYLDPLAQAVLASQVDSLLFDRILQNPEIGKHRGAIRTMLMDAFSRGQDIFNDPSLVDDAVAMAEFFAGRAASKGKPTAKAAPPVASGEVEEAGGEEPTETPFMETGTGGTSAAAGSKKKTLSAAQRKIARELGISEADYLAHEEAMATDKGKVANIAGEGGEV